MKKTKPFSRKYYAEELIAFSKTISRTASHCGRLMHDHIEGVNHENQAYIYGGSCCLAFENDEFNFRISIARKSKKEKDKTN